MKKIIKITNLNTNEISSIGAGFSISRDSAVMRLTQSTINELKYNAAFVVGVIKTSPINNMVIPVLSFFAGSVLTGLANKRKLSGELIKQSVLLEKLQGMQ